MPLGKLRQEYEPLPEARSQPQTGPRVEGAHATPSPARALQEQLERSHVAATGYSLEKWSTRRAVAFIVASSAALWMAILITGAQATQVAQAIA